MLTGILPTMFFLMVICEVIRCNACRNTHMKVTTLPYSYFSTVTYNASTNTTQYGGLAFDIFNSFTERYNISYDVQMPNNKFWGLELPNNTWTGMMGLIVHGDINIGVTEFAVSVHRANVSMFSEMFSPAYYVMVVKIPSIEYGHLLFLQPLTSIVWLTFLVSTFIFGIISYLVYHASQKQNITLSLWFMESVGTIFNKGMPLIGRKLSKYSLMFTMTFWWLGVFAILAHYNANLKAIFVTPKGMKIIYN